jgi:hypothetical protein
LCNQEEICLHCVITCWCSGLSPISFNIKFTVWAKQSVQTMCAYSFPISLHAFLVVGPVVGDNVHYVPWSNLLNYLSNLLKNSQNFSTMYDIINVKWHMFRAVPSTSMWNLDFFQSHQ